MNADRKYVAISIKHTEYRWKFGMPCWLWGFHQTEDDEPRCFASYTQYPNKAERYALGDFKEHGYGEIIKDDDPVKLTIDFCKKWKKYDTVLVDAEQYEAYCRIADLPLEPPKTEEKPVRKYRVSWSVPTVKEQIIEAEDIEAAEDWWTHHFLFTGASLDRIELIDGKNAADDAEVC